MPAALAVVLALAAAPGVLWAQAAAGGAASGATQPTPPASAPLSVPPSAGPAAPAVPAAPSGSSQALPFAAQPFQPEPPSGPNFTVGAIRVEGLHRITLGTLYNYLPIDIGDHLNTQRIQQAIQALYATGFFSDVQMRRAGNTLIVVVTERPSIASVNIKGNKAIKTADLNKALRGVGLSAGRIFDRSTLEQLTEYLTDQYYSRGQYAVQIHTTVSSLPNNTVGINIHINEGARAVIRQINLVGNTSFSDKAILRTLKLHTPGLFSLFTQNDRYSRQSLQGDLTSIQAYYQDRGYANMHIDSVQVTISPDKKSIFITVELTEGSVYRLGTIRLAGNLIVPHSQLERLLEIRRGQIYSQKAISDTDQAIQNRLSQDGYYFAKVDPVPMTNPKTHIVNLTLFVDPGNRVYVRHINFTGTKRTNDETMRREMRQLEGAWLSNVELQRSKVLLQRLPFVKNVDMSTKPVPGSPDMVDVNFAVTERPASTIGGGVGYSAYQKLVLNGNYSDSDFLGTGDFLSVNVDTGAYQQVYSFSETNPYVTVNGLSRTLSLSYANSTQFVAQSSSFGSKNFALGLSFSYPISEYQGVTAGVTLEHNDLVTYSVGSALQAIQWVRENGSPYQHKSVYTSVLPDGTTITTSNALVGSTFNSVELSLGWGYDTRNRTVFASRGLRTSLSFSFVPPGSAVRYWIGRYLFQGYLPLFAGLTLSEDLRIDYGKPLGGTTALPPYKRFFAGGPDTVRGYTEDTLGPVDSNGNPYGGNLLTDSQTELLLPVPQRFQTTARLSLFFDMGNVFSTDGTQFYGKDLQTPLSYGFRYDALKESAGIAVEWLAPSFGIFRFSFGVPLNPSSGNSIRFADQKEGFQFTVGQSF